MSAAAVLFPGQGSLTPDAAAHARDVRPALVDRACALVGDDPFERAAESTRYAQPATFVASLAGWSEHEEDVDDILAMAGHSLGELSALVAAGALAVDDGLRLVVIRGRLMADAAGREAAGGMVALLGGEPEAATTLAARHGLTLANDNAPGQLVLSGARAAIERLVVEARSAGFKTIVLDVAGAFHSPAMALAERPFRRALENTPWREPVVPVVSGCTAAPFRDIPLELSCALLHPVRWREVMAALVERGAEQFIDVGPGQVLARLAKRNLPARERHVVAR